MRLILERTWGDSLMYSSGYVKDLKDCSISYRAATRPGSSGGAVFDARGGLYWVCITRVVKR